MKIAIAAEAIDTTMHHNDLASPSNSEKASKRKMPLFRYIGLADMVQAVTVFGDVFVSTSLQQSLRHLSKACKPAYVVGNTDTQRDAEKQKKCNDRNADGFSFLTISSFPYSAE